MYAVVYIFITGIYDMNKGLKERKMCWIALNFTYLF